MLFSSSECINLFTVTLTVFVAIVTANLLSIVLFIKNRSLRIRAMYLVINLTVVDMFVGGFSHLLQFLYLSYTRDIVKMNLSQELDVIIAFLFFWFPLTSLTNIAVISLDQMHATIRPFRHGLIKTWVYRVTIAGVWVLAAMLSTVILILGRYGKEWSYHLYLWQFVKFLSGAHPQHHGAANRQRKLAVTLFIMTIVSLLMWPPHATLTIYFQSSSRILSLSVHQDIYRLECSLKILYLKNSLVNPIVYTIRMPDFRKALL